MIMKRILPAFLFVSIFLTSGMDKALAESKGDLESTQSILIAEVKKAKITEEWVYTNESSIYRQLGMISIS